jgi:hypothetical protein
VILQRNTALKKEETRMYSTCGPLGHKLRTAVDKHFPKLASLVVDSNTGSGDLCTSLVLVAIGYCRFTAIMLNANIQYLGNEGSY